MLSFVLAAVAGAAPRPAIAIAIVPPVSVDGADTWLGLAVADNLANDLLRYERKDAQSGRMDYPLNVFSWRESTAAARAEGLDLGKPLSPESVTRLAKQLGSRYVFTGSYRLKAGKTPQVLLKWRLVDIESERAPKETRVTTNLATLSRRTDALVAAVLRAVGERAAKSKAAPPKYRIQALRAYAGGLEVLARQSLDPHAQVVLPAIEIKKARLLFEEATRAAPDLLRAWVGMALASAMLGDLERAEKEMLHALAHAERFEPFNAVGLYYLHVRQSRPQDASKALQEAVAKHPGFLGALGYLGSAHLRAGQAKKAIEVFRVYKERVPKSPWARIMYARALAYAGKYDEALLETQAVQRDHPDSLAVTVSLAARLTQSGKYDEASAVLERGITKYGQHPALLTRLSYVQLQQGSAEPALALAERAVEAQGDGRGEPLAGYAYANLGHAYALLGKKPEALAAFKKAAELGIGIEERVLLLTDERTKSLMQDPANPLATDAPPPPAAAAVASAVASAEESEDAGEDESVDEEAESWEENEEWSESDDWSEEDLDDEVEPKVP